MSAPLVENSAIVDFRYRAARTDGTIETGIVRATTADAANEMVAGRGVWVIDVHRDIAGLSTRRGPSLADLALGLRLLGSLLTSGLPLPRALSALDDMAPTAWIPALPSIRSAVQRGEPLANALTSSALHIPPVVIGMIRAGEAGSGLPTAVRRSASLIESQSATRAAIRSALAYPAILAVASVASVALLIGVVLPRFAAILHDLGDLLPPTTQALLTAADLIRRLALPGIVLLILASIAWRAWATSTAGRSQWHTWLLSLPAIGSIRYATASAGFAHALGALLESGVPIGIALRAAADASGDAAIGYRVTKARERVVAGERLAAALSAESATTATVLRLVRAGEESGNLAEMLTHAATLEQERAERNLKSLVRLIEPSLILAFGGLVAFVAAALLQAVYSVRPGT